MTNHIIVCSGSNELTIKPLCTIEDYIRFNVKIRSGEFAGTSNFCISRDMLRVSIDQLSQMHSDLTGSCELRDYDSDANLKIEMRNLGHMDISGQIGGSHQDHNMKFKFATDQTVLNNLIQALKAMCY